MLHLYKGKITIDKENLPDSKAIRTIVDKFKAADALKILMFMYLVFNRSEDNPIREFALSERTRRAKALSFKDTTATIATLFPKDTKLIATAFKEYENLTVDKIQRDIDLYDKKMYQFINLLNENELEIIKNTHEISGRVTYSTNIDIITTILDNSINIILDKAALAHMQKTGRFSNDLRGGLSPNIKGKLKTN